MEGVDVVEAEGGSAYGGRSPKSCGSPERGSRGSDAEMGGVLGDSSMKTAVLRLLWLLRPLLLLALL